VGGKSFRQRRRAWEDCACAMEGMGTEEEDDDLLDFEEEEWMDDPLPDTAPGIEAGGVGGDPIAGVPTTEAYVMKNPLFAGGNTAPAAAAPAAAAAVEVARCRFSSITPRVERVERASGAGARSYLMIDRFPKFASNFNLRR